MIQKLLAQQGRFPEKWTFGNLKRQADGSFPDEGLVRILQAATDDVAGTFFGVLYMVPF